MHDRELFEKAFSPLHASPDTMTEVMKMTERKTKRPALRRAATLGLAAALVLALGSDVPVYVTLDLDVLDPSLFCGTGTPEAGGVFFQDLEEALLALEALNVVGFDMNELSPHYDASGVSTAVACKVLREMLLAYVK